MAAPRFGLTGGIGSGKSTVAAIWVSLGATLVDTDAIAHSISAAGGAALPALRAAFGDDIERPDGGLDRARMRALVFADPDAKRRLEALLHPLIGAEAMRQAEAAGGPVVFDVPLLAESAHWRARCRRILVVDCGEATQIRRVMARSGWPESQVRHVMVQQAPRAVRRSVADAVIDNDHDSVERLQEAATRLWRHWTGVAV